MYIDEGKQAVITPTAAVAAGSVYEVVANKLYGIAHCDIAANTSGVVDLVGKFGIAKDATSTFALGDKVYWTAAGATSTAGTNPCIGIAAAAAVAADKEVIVYFDGKKPASV